MFNNETPIIEEVNNVLEHTGMLMKLAKDGALDVVVEHHVNNIYYGNIEKFAYDLYVIKTIPNNLVMQFGWDKVLSAIESYKAIQEIYKASESHVII